MSDVGPFGGPDEEYAIVRKLNADLEADPDNFETWENLIKACEALEGGLNRNSSPQALDTFRNSYNRFLSKFPFFFGYWKKYADTEFSVAGPESAEMVYEKGCASINTSVDLWTEYCSFKMETTHDPQLVRELFERASTFIGLDFLAHPFWDKYIEYEERQEAHDRIFALLERIIRIPMHQYTRYFERLRTLALSRPLSEVVSPETLARFRLEVQNEAAAASGPQRSELEIERDIRTKIDGLYIDVYGVTNAEVQKRWLYESEVKRPYFHVTELESAQIANWHKYLDFEESEGEYARIVALYERCMVSCALYDEFWFRYVRWMDAQPGKDEETRHIYMRAAILVPISRPGIRLQWALFEESRGRVEIAADIHAAILLKLPDCVEVIVSWANLRRRQNGVDAAIQVYRDHIDAPTVDLYTKAALVGEWAHLVWKFQGSVDEARGLFLKNVQWYADSRAFWDKWFQFELDQPVTTDTAADHATRVKHVFDEFISRTRLSTETKREVAQLYLKYLIQNGGKEAMKTFLQVDRGIFGPPSVATMAKVGSAAKENGAGRAELDEAQRQKAEGGYVNFFELHKEPNLEETQGTTSFH
ncbi:hypothetical protein S7711_02447 [Stachybotrys chartarum IBT 7711]|uniref:Suppressor of forked domain-containing protein n=1 Tax=Stachybotrys chartarum (strain CBS 109288 / IBT 7711) TaxID=1280523 RepID=A0A084AQE9_STACB|nr:hypothetical protein S7711_02447 [Stachybotrys chartarum IBT 7711]KFA48448.1 hypothetical protein S40293_00263 [Stachybotrys chartarum IBT 40293]KFA73222.1 hypothetical protein S40288_05400 [Stachybotrys chartarum IBT 40288]